MESIDGLEAMIKQAAEEAGPAVVGLGRGWGRGSGVVIAPGRVLTNAHNLRHDEATVSFVDGRHEPGHLVGSDLDVDLAAIEVQTGDVRPLQWSSVESTQEIGTAVVALGNPGGRGLRVTAGFVSASPRSFRGPRGRRIAGAIEHTAPLPRGSSGGPLLDRGGAVIGLNTLRVEGGLIIAIGADAGIRERVEALCRGEASRQVTLGIAIAPPAVARRMRRAVGLPEREGVLVRAVQDESPAERHGLERGDLIVQVAGRTVDRVDVLYEALDAAQATGRLELVFLRGTDEHAVVVSL